MPANQSTPEVTRADRDELQRLQDFLREPDHAENFGTDQLIEWINRRPTHIIPRILSRSPVPATPARGGDELREAAQGVLSKRWASSSGEWGIPEWVETDEPRRFAEQILASTDMAGAGEGAQGTFACPICGQDTPHHHTPAVVDAYHNKGSRA